MIKRLSLYFLIFLSAVVALVYYNYTKAQENLRQAKPSLLAIELGEIPSETTVNTPVKFVWEVDASEDFTAVTTGIYYGYDSTPSATTKFDSPKALAYPDYTYDYLSGRFKLPDTFDANLSFPKPGTVYYRAYALVGADHLWTGEGNITVK